MHALRFVAMSLVWIGATVACAQQVNTGVGNSNVGDSFSESIGSHWAIGGRGWFANFGGAAGVPFGGQPGGLTGGGGFGGHGFSGGFGFTAGQGYSSSIGGTSGSLTSLNGAQGYLFNGTLTPFVTEIMPVVGSGTTVPVSPLQLKLQQAGGPGALRPPLRLPEAAAPVEQGAKPRPSTRDAAATGGVHAGASSAERGDLSVAAIRAAADAEAERREAQVSEFLEAARRCEAAGNTRDAALLYNKAAAKVEGARRAAFLEKARELRGR